MVPMFVDLLLPNHLNQAFTYRVPGGMTLGIGDYVLAPFAGRMLPAVVWGEAAVDVAHEKIKPIAEAFTHLPPMPAGMRAFVERTARYTLSPRGAVLKMCLPSFAALNAPTARERAANVAPTHYTPPSLTEAQAAAAAALHAKIRAGYGVALLDGVTGSGKTEVYFDAMAHVLAAGKQVLVLLPEIALSVQWLSRFEARFGTRPHVWHSSISPAQRKHTWRAIVQGKAQVVVGARSALFLPYANLGMVVVDEEHEATFKQDDGVMYHARDMAVLKAHIEKIPVVLASATPSLETWHNVQQKKYQLISLPKRYTGVEMPQVQLVDMRQEALGRGDFLAKPLMESMVQAMAEGKQALLFLNRRGYAPLMLCQHCGHRFECKSCSAWLVQHKQSPRLSCHHCGHAEMVPKTCPACGSEEKLQAVGPGIERIAEEITRRMPEARIAVLSSDIESHDEVQQVLTAMQNGDLDVLIGTQLIAKGHHFPKLRVVGVVDADLGLEGGDPRAVERTYQVLHQIGGRAGREEERGMVFIQTYAPEHPVMKALAASERNALMELELKMRKAAHMPPFSRLANVLIDGTDERTVLSEARRLAAAAPNHPKLRVLGPAPAPLYRLKNRFRVRILLQADRALDMQSLVLAWLEEVRPARSVHVKIDVDPYHFL